MPAKIEWRPDQDATIRRMAGAGAPHEAIARAVGVSRWCARDRMDALGIAIDSKTGPRRKEVQMPDQPMIPWRDPLPAGHPISWTALTAGTCLDGSAYQPDG
jgi:hypothetical protein